MVEFHCDRIVRVIHGLNQLLRAADAQWFDAEKVPPFEVDHVLHLQTEMQGILFAVQTNHLDMPHSQREAENVLREIEIGLHLSSADVHRIAGQILDTVRSELTPLKFAYVPEDKAHYFGQEKLFGEAVYLMYPSARQDIKDAGNCIAADLNTAAVFHLMRVAESGLRALARYCRLSSVTVRSAQRHIQLATWGNIIQGIHQEISRRSSTGTPSTVKRAEAEQFCSRALAALRQLQRGWRDPVSHFGNPYSHHEAVAAFEYVSVFMQELAENGIGESSRMRIPPP